MKLELGTSIRCADGVMRELVDVVIDSGSSRVTHLVIQPMEHPEDARLVPISLASADPEISLSCSSAELEGFDPVHQVEVVRAGKRPDEDPNWDVGVEDIIVAPNYGTTPYGDPVGTIDPDVTISYDRVPKGEIELRHASAVYSADGHHLGSVEGVVVADDYKLRQLLLERGHLWWKRELAVPADAVAKFENDMLTLGVTKRELTKVT
jgi:sporulation protein YlmC with PRC-barrel domain